MAVSVNTTPNNIDSSGKYNVTTSLVEDGTHVNLRIRADIIVAAVIVGTVEKPKGLPDFDLFNILKAEVPGISAYRNTGSHYFASGGSPLIDYTVTFTEVWEDGTTGITTEGDTDTSSSVKFVPARGDGLPFINYVLATGSCRFANKTLRNGVTKFNLVNPVEMWLCFFTEQTTPDLKYNKDGGGWTTESMSTPDGWGVIVLNASNLMNGVTDNLQIYVDGLSEVITIYVESTDIKERVTLEYDGLVGGKEYLTFEGLNIEEFVTARSYYDGVNRNRKGLKFTGVNRQTIESRYQDINNSSYLKSLLISEGVWKLYGQYEPIEATVITESIKYNDTPLYTNRLDIEMADVEPILNLPA
jgi:hypothetical protein